MLSAVGHSAQKKQILILNSYHKGYLWTDGIVKGIEETLTKRIENCEILIEYMDTKRINTDEYKEAFFQLLKMKYAKINLDIIIVSDDNAFLFAVKYHRRLFGDTPIVFMGVNNFSPSMIVGHEEQITGIVQDADIPATLNTALKLHPDTTQIAVICDATTTGQAYIRQVAAAESQFETLKFIYLDGTELTTSEMLTRLSSLPDNSIALLCIWMKDRNGVFVPLEIGYTAISKNSPVPLYGVLESMLQYGILGGKVQSGKHHGAESAKIALKILDSKKVTQIPVELESPNTYMFNYKKLQKWNIVKTALPPGSVILNEPQSVYYQYKNIVWGIIGIFAFLLVVIAVLGSNIIRRKSAEENLRKSEEKLRAIFEASPNPVVLYDNQGHPKYLNPAFTQVFGWSLHELEGKAIPFVPDDQKEITSAKIKELYESEKIVRIETKRLTKDWRYLDIIISAASIRDSEGEVSGIIVNLTDITDMKKLESQLLQAQKMEAIGTLAGGVAHDLNNILSGLVSYPELLLMDIPADSPLRKPILTIQDSGQKAAVIVQDLLTLARRGVAITEVVNLNDIVYDHLDSPEHEKLGSFHPGAEFEINLAPDLLNIMGSPVHLSKTIMNLLSNAAEAISDAGTITMSTSNQYLDRPVKGYEDVQEGDYVVLSVVDSGTGMSEKDLARIFEPFYTKKIMGKSGTGLGMAVIWGTVKDHNGYIDVQSKKGMGSSFTLYFPVTRKKRAKDDALLPIEEYMGQGESVLVVDDVAEQREIATWMLSKLNYSVTSVSSGEEAVEYMKNNSADLIVIDMIMDPGINGRETYERIINLNPNQKAIIASGFSETDHVKAAQKLGAGQYIKKPYTLEKIGTAVRDELKK